MSKEGFMEYWRAEQERKGKAKQEPQTESVAIRIDRIKEEMEFKRQHEDGDFELRGVNLTDRSGDCIERSAQARKAKILSTFGQRITGFDRESK